MNKGDIRILNASGRVFSIVEEIHVTSSNPQECKCGLAVGSSQHYCELIQFDDEPRHPIWHEHNSLMANSRWLTASETKARGER